MTKYVCKEDKKISTKNGIHAMFLEAGVPREIPDFIVVAAVSAGARPFIEGQIVEDVAANDEEREAVARIVNAMRDILTEDNPALLTGAGIPRAGEIERRVKFDTSKEQRDAAWAEIEG